MRPPLDLAPSSAQRGIRIRSWCAAVGVAVLCLAGPPCSSAEALDVAVIVHRDRSLGEVSLAELERIFTLRRQRWDDGERIYLLMQEQGSREKRVVLDRVYRMSSDELKRFWLGKIYRGELAYFPKTLGSSGAVRRFVSQVRNAIGYVDARELDDSVRVLRIDGRLPGEEGYRLRSEEEP